MSAASGATSLASAVNIGAFNLGNAIGALAWRLGERRQPRRPDCSLYWSGDSSD